MEIGNRKMNVEIMKIENGNRKMNVEIMKIENGNRKMLSIEIEKC
jgi:hypothetical protein